LRRSAFIALQRRRMMTGMTLYHYAGLVAVPALVAVYFAAIRWATRTNV
jgi:hypothetical protein